jgi:hypothetical protein
MNLTFFRWIRLLERTRARKPSDTLFTRQVLFSCLLLTAGQAAGQDTTLSNSSDRGVPRDVLTEAQWTDVENSVDRGLEFLSQAQKPDGCFNGDLTAEPGITGLCVMAFLSRGHLPGEGIYGENLSRSVEYLLSSQQKDGLIARDRHKFHAAYSHGIGALVLAELYGMAELGDEARHRIVIERAIDFCSHRYSQPKANADDEGGWRYLQRHAVSDSDLSVTSWNLMFLRSAKNSGFNIDPALVEDALVYMQGLYDRDRRTFRYENHTDDPEFIHSRGMAAAGVLSLSLAGKHNTDMAQGAAAYILRRPYDQYTMPIAGEQYPCYGAFYCSQAMYQMGGKYWREFFPTLSATIVKAQQDDGSWTLRSGLELHCGVSYMTALSVLALTPSYQMLPIFQR